MKITVQDYKDKNKIEKNPSHDSSVDKNIHTQIQFKNLDSTLIQFFQKKSFFMIIQIKKIIQQNTMKKQKTINIISFQSLEIVKEYKIEEFKFIKNDINVFNISKFTYSNLTDQQNIF